MEVAETMTDSEAREALAQLEEIRQSIVSALPSAAQARTNSNSEEFVLPGAVFNPKASPGRTNSSPLKPLPKSPRSPEASGSGFSVAASFEIGKICKYELNCFLESARDGSLKLENLTDDQLARIHRLYAPHSENGNSQGNGSSETMARPVSAPHQNHKRDDGWAEYLIGHKKERRESAEMDRSSADGMRELTKEEEEEEKLWLENAENAYGAFIHVALESGIPTAFVKCGPMLVFSVFIQVIFSQTLYDEINKNGGVDAAKQMVEDDEIFGENEWGQYFCEIPADLQISAVGVFVTLMLNNVPSMVKAGMISLLAHKRKSTTSEAQDLGRSRLKRACIFVCAVLTEAFTWFAILGSGVLFILTAQSVELVIRSTVAIMFVQNVDEVVYDACCSRDIKEGLEMTRYRLGVHLKASDGHRLEKMQRLYGLFFHLPLIAGATCALVFSLRYTGSPNCD